MILSLYRRSDLVTTSSSTPRLLKIMIEDVDDWSSSCSRKGFPTALVDKLDSGGSAPTPALALLPSAQQRCPSIRSSTRFAIDCRSSVPTSRPEIDDKGAAPRTCQTPPPFSSMPGRRVVACCARKRAPEGAGVKKRSLSRACRRLSAGKSVAVGGGEKSVVAGAEGASSPAVGENGAGRSCHRRRMARKWASAPAPKKGVGGA